MVNDATSRIGVLGCGRISPAYLTAGSRFANLDIVACADLDAGRARARADAFGVARACGPAELLAMDDLDVIVNLTQPADHHALTIDALRAGKAVYVEKPLATSRERGAEVLAAAAHAGRPVACSPDTFLSPVLQACRTLIDQGAIGVPHGAVAFFASPGPELTHPDPAFLYQPGGGPLLDIGPYYLAALVSLLGPVTRVSGSTTSAATDRVVLAGPRRGATVPVGTPTHVAATLDFASGVVANLLMSFDVWATELPRIEIYGSAGTLSIPDPDGYTGRARLRRAGAPEWREVAVPTYVADRAIGLADLAAAMPAGRPPRASAEFANHVLDICLSVLDSADRGSHVDVASRCERPVSVPVNGVLP
jgi:predicted dehydrogenase